MRPSQHIQPPLSSGASGVQPRVRLPAAFPPLLPQLQGADPRSYSHHAQGQLQPMSHEANMMGVTDPRSHHQRFNVQPQMPPFFPPLHPPRQHHSIYYPPAVPPPPLNFNTASNPPGFLPPNPFHLPRPPPQHWPPEVPGHMHAMPPIATYPLPQFPHYQNQPETNFASGQILGVPNSWGRGPPPPPEAGVPPPGSSGVGAVEQLDPFVEDWLKIVGAARKQRCPEHSSLKIPEARSLVRSAVELLSSLRQCHQRLASLDSTDDGSRWRSIMRQVVRHKEELEVVRGRLKSGDTVEHLARKLDRHRAKRDHQRWVWKERACAAAAKRNQAEAAANSWLEEKRKKELKEKTEKTVQAAASGLLGEVKRKQSEVQLFLKLADALRDLRDSRREANRKKGDAPPIEADERFTSGHTSLLQLLTNQVRVYEGEEHALRVLMEEEVAEKMATSVAKATTDKGPEAEQEDDPLPSLVPFDPLAPFRGYYLQAERGGEPLLTIRTEWDRYLSPKGAPIPPGPVEATPPSSSLWAWCHVEESSQ